MISQLEVGACSLSAWKSRLPDILRRCTGYRTELRVKVPIGPQPRQNDGYDHLQDLLVHSLVLGEAHLWNPYTPCRHELEVGQSNNELFLLIVCIHRHRLPGGVACSLCAGRGFYFLSLNSP
jgi:hypothetical protein